MEPDLWARTEMRALVGAPGVVVKSRRWYTPPLPGCDPPLIGLSVTFPKNEASGQRRRRRELHRVSGQDRFARERDRQVRLADARRSSNIVPGFRRLR